MNKLNVENIEALASRIKVVLLSQGIFNVNKTHKKETEQERIKHKTNRIRKVEVILTENVHLKNAANLKARIYNENKRITLPSPIDGMRVLPLGREWEHTQIVSNLINQYNEEVALFIDDLPNVRTESKDMLNGLYDDSMIPTAEELRSCFYNNIRYMSAPTNGNWGEFLNETLEIGRLELRDRLVKAARKLIEVCSNDCKLYSSVLDKLSNICELAGDLNLMEDPIIAKAAKDLRVIAQDYDAQTLRRNRDIRIQTAEKADRILKVLNLS